LRIPAEDSYAPVRSWLIDAGSANFIETPISWRYLIQDDRIEVADGQLGKSGSSVEVSPRAKVVDRKLARAPREMTSGAQRSHRDDAEFVTRGAGSVQVAHPFGPAGDTGVLVTPVEDVRAGRKGTYMARATFPLRYRLGWVGMRLHAWPDFRPEAAANVAF
jgi:hypothetical protein